MQTRIQYCSDLHFEFPENRSYLAAAPIEPKGDILLLAGDIVPFAGMEKENDFFNFVSDHFEHTFWIPGNHEYYRSDITHRSGAFREAVRANVSLLNNTTVVHRGVRLVFSTLWSKTDPRSGPAIQRSMADFHLIKKAGRRLTLDDYDRLHEDCRAFLARELADHDTGKTVVVTHHVPTFLNYPEKYRYSELNTGFATELGEHIEQSGAEYWIYGHSHECVADFTIGRTTLTTNQLGYVGYGEHLAFSREKTIYV